MSAEMTGAIVVGMDGSDHADRALGWAIEEAKLRGAVVKVVAAWHVPAFVYGAPGFVPLAGEPLDDQIRAAAERVATAAAERVRTAGLEADAVVQQGQAADVLVDAAANADLLVVGSHGHGGFTGLLLGSVSAQCAHHSPCPLVIVR
jgi:nucleotide-binding universal stress UspA family protein